jgi:hypothetical protein
MSGQVLTLNLDPAEFHCLMLQEVAFSGNTFALKPEQQGAVLDVASAAAAREVSSRLFKYVVVCMSLYQSSPI